MSSRHDRPEIDRCTELGIAAVVDALCGTDDVLARSWKKHRCQEALPSRHALIDMVESLRAVLFPGHFGLGDSSSREGLRFQLGAALDRVARTLEEQVRRGLSLECDGEAACCAAHDQRASEVTRAFIARLPEVRRLLATDVQAAYEGDPAATSTDEAIFCYPCIKAVTNYRLAHELYQLCVPLIPRIITEHAHSLTGIDIHPGATIGEGFFIDHGTGVVIGETTVIGRRVRIYQGVTLGAKSFPRDAEGNLIKGIARHPIVEDEVIIYSGATILGRITIGKGSAVGGNVWLTHSVPPNSRITQEHTQEHTEG